MRATLLSTLAFAFVVSGCISISTEQISVAPPLTRKTVPPTTTTTTVPPTATTAPVPTAAPPLPAELPPSEPVDAVRRAIVEYEDAQLACIATPESCDPTLFVRGAQLEATTQFLQRIMELHAYGRRRDSDPSFWRLTDVSISEDGLTATVAACHWSTDVLELVGGLPFNDERVSYHEIVSLENVDGRWWIVSKFGERRVPETNECGERPQ
jgi:hypothetical protein